MARATAPQPGDFEKLGVFYLGRRHDLDTDETLPELLLYDAKDLTTHALCVGMTGSGKTGLCVGLLEEAAIDGVPAIAIDPKGDLGNLLLTFPNLAPSDFAPWVDPAEAARKGLTVEAQAEATAQTWTDGLAAWGQDAARIARLKTAAEFAIYTPGSSAGQPLSVLRSFDPPVAELLEDAEALRERVSSTVSGVLALLDIDADPVQSREHVLLSTILLQEWQQGRSLDLGGLIRAVQTPPFDRVGVLDLESFYPSKHRAELALRLNGLLASPGFAGWLEGPALDVQRLLWTDAGKPKVSVLSIAHLSDQERMFFVTVLLNEMIAWMRRQSGTGSLRAILYMDEIFGFFPPTANPPAKGPMLTLLKQARAFGVGIVLATQNPVDLDYKGLSNCGTWFLGRLQTERDKARVMEGLEGVAVSAGQGFDRQRMERTLAGLGSRVFLMNNVHDDEPVVFHTRWALSYLRGPLTRTQIQTLMEGRRGGAMAAGAASRAPESSASELETTGSAERPVLPAEAGEAFLVPDAQPPEGVLYRPALLASVDVHYANARAGVDTWQTLQLLAPLEEDAGADPWDDSLVLEEPPRLTESPATGATFGAVPPRAANGKSYDTWGKALKTHVYQDRSLTLYRCRDLKLISEVGETEGEFRVRLREAARERRDGELEKLRKKYATKLARLEKQAERAEARLGREQAQLQQQTMQTAISVGATVLGALLGRKRMSVGTVGRATTAARGASRRAREKQDVARAQRELEQAHEESAALEEELSGEIAAVGAATDPDAYEIDSMPIRARKSDITLGKLSLVWLPATMTLEIVMAGGNEPGR